MTDRAWLRFDRFCRRLKRCRGENGAWKTEICEFLGIPVHAWPSEWARTRRSALQLWQAIRAADGPPDFSLYYAERYFTLRGAWYRRHDTFYTILRTMRAEQGLLLDYGCGVGTVGRWLLQRRPGWQGTFVDIPSLAQHFVRWRLRQMAGMRGYATTPSGFTLGTLNPPMPYDVIVCLDVFEHLSRPHQMLARLLDCLRPGGHLFCSMSPDMDGENIGGPYRPDVIAVLDLTCETRLSMTATTQYGHYIKR